MLQAKRQPRLIVKLKSTNSRTRTQLRLGDPWPGQKPDRLPWLLQCSVSNHICLCFQSSSRNSAPLSELCPPAGSAQTAVSRHTADGQAHHAERRWHTHKHTLYSPLFIYKYIKRVCVFQNWSAVHFFPPSLCCWTNRTCWTLSGYIIFTSCRAWLLSTTLHVWLLITGYFCLLFQNSLSSCFCNTFTILVFGSHFCLLYFSREPGWRLRSEWAEDRRWGFFCFFCSVVPRTFSRGCSV